ncbi:MAG: adenosylcobinamide-phosphate synthase CbiB [Acidobacteriota bacterium]
MAVELAAVLAPSATALAVAVAIDLAAGDPVYGGHPVRLIGRTLQWLESALRRISADGYAGGIVLFVGLAAVWVIGPSIALVALSSRSSIAGWGAHLFLLYSFLALGDLLQHGWRIERALGRGNRHDARVAVARLVGRDTDRLDDGGCRRAAIESLSESLTDGFISPLCWYVAAGIPGLALFKVVSTMDSMVGYKTPRYLRFGWCGARLDDAMNFLPARLTFGLVAATAAVLPGCSARKALRVGWSQHAILPGPNSGWSEATCAGALQRKLVGPIWMHGRLVTDVWLGDPADPPLETAGDYRRASVFILVTGLAAAAAGWVVLIR